MLVAADRKVKEMRSVHSEAWGIEQRLCSCSQSAQTLLQYRPFRIVGLQGNAREGLKSAEISYICSRFASVLSENKALEERYLYLVNENDQLKVRNSQLRHQFLSLINTTSSVSLDSIKETASLLGKQTSLLTYNQVLTGVEEMARREASSEAVEGLEKVEVHFFSSLVELGKQVVGTVRRGDRLGRLAGKALALEEAIEGVDPDLSKADSDLKPGKSPISSLSRTVGKLFPPLWAERLMGYIRRSQMLQLFLTPADLPVLAQTWKHDEASFVQLLSQLTPTSHACLRYKAASLLSALLRLLYTTSTEEDSDKACESSLEEAGRIRTEPADLSVYEETGESASAALSNRSKVWSRRKGKDSADSQTPRKSAISMSPRKTMIKLKLFDSFEEVDEEEELNLLQMARKALKMRNRTSTDAPCKPSPRLSTYVKPPKITNSLQFDDVRQLRSTIAKVRLQGISQTELESQGKRRLKRPIMPFIRENSLKRTPKSEPQWRKSVYFPLLQYSVKQQVKSLLRASHTALTS